MALCDDHVSNVMCITIKKLEDLRQRHTAVTVRVSGDKDLKPIKQTIKHMAGKRLTKKQYEANEKLSGMNQSFYANQIITLIESDLLDVKNEKLIATLVRLRDLLDGLFQKEKKRKAS